MPRILLLIIVGLFCAFESLRTVGASLALVVEVKNRGNQVPFMIGSLIGSAVIALSFGWLLRYIYRKTRPASKQSLYDAVADELTRKSIKPGLWARAIAEAGTDDAAAHARYIALRVSELKDEQSPQRVFRSQRCAVDRREFIALLWFLLAVTKSAGSLLGTLGGNPVVGKALWVALYLACAMAIVWRLRSIGWKWGWLTFALTAMAWAAYAASPSTSWLVTALFPSVALGYFLIAVPPHFGHAGVDTPMRVWSWMFGVTAALLYALRIVPR